MLIYRTIELVEYHTIVYSLDRDTMVFADRIPHPRPPTTIPLSHLYNEYVTLLNVFSSYVF